MVCGKSKEALKWFFCEAEEKGRQGMVSIRSLKATEWSENLNFCLELTLNLALKANTTEIHPKVRPTCYILF